MLQAGFLPNCLMSVLKVEAFFKYLIILACLLTFEWHTKIDQKLYGV